MYVPESPTEVTIDLLRELVRSLSLPVLVDADTSDPAVAARLLDAGVCRIFIERAALDDPARISRLARRFGTETIGVTITARIVDGVGQVQRGEDGGETEWDAVTWGRVVEAQGGGELTFRPAGAGFGPAELDLLGALVGGVARPVVAAVGTQAIEEALDALLIGDADAVRIDALRTPDDGSLPRLKRSIAEHGLAVRL